jgi:PEP-CTERM motif-containing protein
MTGLAWEVQPCMDSLGRSKTMKKTLALFGLMGMMGAAQAIPIYVNYQGVVGSVVGTPLGHATGDVITGQLVIESDFAGENASYEAGHSWFNQATSPAFVSGYTSGAPIAGFATDSVEVFDGYAGLIDGYYVSDYERTTVGGQVHQGGIELWVQSYYEDFTDGTGIDQNFSLTSAAGLFYGSFWQQIDSGDASYTMFRLTEFSVSTRSVPEPATLGLFALGSAMAFVFRRRRLRIPSQ